MLQLQETNALCLLLSLKKSPPAIVGGLALLLLQLHIHTGTIMTMVLLFLQSIKMISKCVLLFTLLCFGCWAGLSSAYYTRLADVPNPMHNAGESDEWLLPLYSCMHDYCTYYVYFSFLYFFLCHLSCSLPLHHLKSCSLLLSVRVVWPQ